MLKNNETFYEARGGDESRLAAFSEDGGRTWEDCPKHSPWNDNVQTSGVLGYLNDGTIAYIDVFPVEMGQWPRKWFRQYVANPSWRLRRFSPTGDLLEDTAFHVCNRSGKGVTNLFSIYQCFLLCLCSLR